jgi:hypothetical protein
LLPKWQRYGPAAIVHDYLYASQHTDRRTADATLNEGMHDMRVLSWERYVIYGFVRAFGGFVWNSHAKNHHEVVCMTTDFPTDPRQTWEQWKAKHER